MKKSFYTYDEQIKKLESDGLIIIDREEVLTSLKNVGYYKFIKGYNNLFLKYITNDRGEVVAHRYKENVRFEDIKAIYDFDFELRNIIYKRLSAIEIMIKSLVSYEFSEKHGVDHKTYLKKNCFNSNSLNRKGVATLIKMCKKTIADASELESGSYRKYIAYHVEKYGQVPVWALFMALTFGNVSKFYQFMKVEEQEAIAVLFKVNHFELENILKIIVKFRNIVFHHERLYDANLYKERLSSKLKVVESLSIPKNESGENKYGKNDFLSLMIALKYLLNEVEFASLVCEIDLALENLAKKTSQKYVDAVKTKMRIKRVNLKMLAKVKN